jgi:hypothetical protein
LRRAIQSCEKLHLQQEAVPGCTVDDPGFPWMTP